MTLDQARERVGQRVAYTGGARREYGRITRVTERWVFVHYEGDSGAKATSPNDLVLANREGDAA